MKALCTGISAFGLDVMPIPYIWILTIFLLKILIMDKNLIAEHSVHITAPASKVWAVLTTPKHIKAFLFGTKVKTDWNVGSPIVFQGEYEGHKYKDKGNVIARCANRLLVYTYWSSFSGLEDVSDNYSTVHYMLESVGTGTRFTWRQVGFSSTKGCEHTQAGLAAMLETIKGLAE